MPELEPFDARLGTAVHAFADRAQTSVDAAAVAQHAMRHRRAGRLGWLAVPVPVPVSILVILVLLVPALALSLGFGVARDRGGAVLPVQTASPTPAAPTVATHAPQAIAASDGRGDDIVTGTVTLVLAVPYTESRAGDVTRLRDGEITVTIHASDARITGTGTWLANADLYSAAGPQWGTLRLENAGGAWDGTCSGSAWDGGDSAAWSCWLTGSGAYDGYSHYFSATWNRPGAGDVRGVTVPASPPAS